MARKARDVAHELGSLLCEAGMEARFAGGCVRDRLLDVEPKDYDLATTGQPGEVRAFLKSKGYKVIPTGLSHGTLTVVQDGIPVEVTTLRRDVACDGRHAEVAFSTSFEEDARRRDFTINALFERMDGRIDDYVGGLADMKVQRLAFVGNPSERIEEDALRILRYFRFLARLKWDMIPDYEDAIIRHKPMLALLSRERIKAEMDQIVQHDSGRILEQIRLLGLFHCILPLASPPEELPLDDLYVDYPIELTALPYRWFSFIHRRYPRQDDLFEALMQARFSRREASLIQGLDQLTQAFSKGQNGLTTLFHLKKRNVTTFAEIGLFFDWFTSPFPIPEITRRVLERGDDCEVPSIQNHLQRIQPPQKRQQMAFLFQISWYLGLCQDVESIDFAHLEKTLRKMGYHSERDFHGHTPKNTH